MAITVVQAGAEQQVNTSGNGNQENATITALGGGGWVVVWQSSTADGGYGIVARIYDAFGNPGAEILVNSDITAGSQVQPSVTALAGGDWIVTFTSPDGSGDNGITSRRFNAVGQGQGQEPITGAPGNEVDSAVATDVNGDDVLVAWQAPDASGQGIFLSYYKSGTPLLTGAQVNDDQTFDQTDPSVAVLSDTLAANDGGWVVTWTSGGDIFQQRYTAAGAAFAEMRVNTTVADNQTSSSVTALPDGGWLVTWVSDGPGGGIFQQRYTADGSAIGASAVGLETRVNLTTTGLQGSPFVTVLQGGGWVITWQSASADGTGTNIYQRHFTSTGATTGADLLVNTTTANDQTDPVVTATSDGGWVVAWTSAANHDGSGTAIIQRKYTPTGSSTLTTGTDLATGTGAAETLTASTGTLTAGDSLDGGDGTDTIEFSGIADFTGVSVSNFETLKGSTQGDILTLSGAQAAQFTTLDGGVGTDILRVSGTADFSAKTVSNFETLQGSAGNDDLSFSTAQFGAFTMVDGGAGTDTLTLVGAGNVSFVGKTISNVEKIAIQGATVTVDAASKGLAFLLDGSNSKSDTVVFDGTFDAKELSDLINVRKIDTVVHAGGTVVTSVAPDDILLSRNEVDENSVAGTVVGKLTATDPNGGTLKITLTDDAGGLFAIDAKNDLVTTASFNFETKASYDVKVLVTDPGGNTREETFQIKVGDVNETATAITFGTPVTTVAEDSGARKLADINITDPDKAALNNNVVTLLKGGDAGFFEIRNGTELWLKDKAGLDFETDAQLQVTVLVDDPGVGSSPDVSKVFTLNVTNTAEAPTAITFGSPVTTVNENTVNPNGVKVAVIGITDSDKTGNNNQISLSGTDSGQFEIRNGTELWLKSSATLDFETKAQLQVTVEVDDPGVGASPDVTKVFTLNVGNVNEAPSTPSLDKTTVDENSKGALVGTLSALDPDAGAALTFSFAPGGNAEDLFAIVGNQLRLKADAQLDFEQDADHTVTVQVSDGTLTASQTFTITVNDLNDAPTLALKNGKSIAENVTVGAGIAVADIEVKDDGKGTENLSLTGADKDLFAIENGKLVFKGASPDFEGKSQYHVTVELDDPAIGAGPEATQAFVLNVTDVNEAPTFTIQDAKTIDENVAVGTGIVVATLAATDDALGTAAFKLSGADAASFKISGTDLVYIGQSPDFEAKGEYKVTVTVQDPGLPAGTAVSKDFTLAVADKNDAPTGVTFTSTPGQPFLETSPAGFTVGTLAGIDKDAGETFEYTLADDAGGRFVIDGDKLVVASLAKFDFEMEPTVKVKVKVKVKVTDDEGLFVIKDVTVAVQNTNEAPTKIFFATGGSVKENSAFGTEIGTLGRDDQDAGDTPTYTIVPGSDPGGLFALIGNKLVVANQAAFNFEADKDHTVKISVKDQANNVHEEELTVAVLNVNEAPTNIALSNSTVKETVSAGWIVGDLVVTDPDGDKSFTWTINDKNFEIVSNQLVVKAGADIDFNNGSARNVVVTANDGAGGIKTQTLTVTITDEPEFPTNITLANGKNTIDENSTQGTAIGKLQTEDADGNENFTYVIKNNPDNLFRIEGDLLVLDKPGLNFEAKDKYDVFIEVKDKDGNLFVDSVEVVVKDVNEPIEDLNLQGQMVLQNATQGTLVGLLSTKDPDKADQGQFKYEVINGNGLFVAKGDRLETAINGFGVLKAGDKHSVQVRVTDGGGHERIESFDINVIDQHYAPSDIFLNGDTVDEDAVVGTEVGTLSAADKNLPQGDAVKFTIANGTGGPFAIAGDKIVVANPNLLDFEEDEFHTVTVIATDISGLFTTKTLSIAVADKNDAPENVTLNGAFLTKDSKAQTVIGYVGATDQDAGEVLSFTLSDNAGGRFGIVDNKIVLVNDQGLQEGNTYTITVAVQDSKGLTADGTFTVHVGAANAAPTGVELTIHSGDGLVSETAKAGTVVGTLKGLDPNPGDGFTYEIIGGAEEAFGIVGDKLVVLDTKAINYEAETFREIDVKVTDTGGLWNIKTLKVDLRDENEAPTLELRGAFVLQEALPGAVVGTLVGIDEDAGETFTYEIVNPQLDSNRFKVVGDKLVVDKANKFNAATTPTHSVKLKVTDLAGHVVEKVFTVHVGLTNDAPDDIKVSGGFIAENAANGTIVATLEALGDTNPGDYHSFEFLEGSDAGRFEIDGNLIVVKNGSLLDFESKTSWDVTVRAKDLNGATVTKSFGIQVTNTNEAPTDIALTKLTLDPGSVMGSAVGVLSATDPDVGETLTFSLTNDAAGLFRLRQDGKTVEWAGTAPAPAAGAKYTIAVAVKDQANLFHTESFDITVGAAVPLNRAPTGATLSGLAVKELAPNASTVVGVLGGVDPDAGNTFTYRLVNDAGGRFALNGNQLVVKNGVGLDYEQAKSHQVVVEVKDQGSLTVQQAFSVQVLNVRPEVTAGSAFNDVIFGDVTKDRLSGGLGNDLLKGAGAVDVLNGGLGNDKLYGGLAKDTLTGGKGKDIFVFDAKLGRTNVDVVKDFVAKDDTFWLDNAVMKKLGKGTPLKPVKLKADAFHAGKTAEDREDRIVYDKAKGALYYDADGSGAAAQVQFATLIRKDKLTYSDFFVI